MTWSIEILDDGFGLVQTKGGHSRTVYFATTSKDADEFIAMMELVTLFKSGVPIEMIKTKPKTRTKK